ncbi:MAG: ROK family protein [Clostridiales bacterium]|nr:ROK family protein [Clostridiales bacterium]
MENGSFEYGKSNQTFLKIYNQKKVLNILRNVELSRIELSSVSSLDKKTITNITKELLGKNQLKVIGHSTMGIGRPKEILGLNGDFTYCIGVDLGGSYISGIIMDFAGEVVCSHHVELSNHMEPDTLINISFNLIDNLLKKASMDLEQIEGIGISIPGFIDKATGLLILSENLPEWFNIPLKQIFEERYGLDTYIDDCSRLMAKAELWYGKGKGVKDFLVFDLGLGIGCGIVIDQKIYAGASGKSGEVGHTVVDVNGPLCTCGRYGCIESLASEWALLQQVNEALKNGTETILRQVMGESKESPTVRDIALAAELGDDYSTDLLIHTGKYIGVGISNAIGLFNPSKVIINGRLVHDNELLLNTILDTIKIETMPQIYEDTVIEESDIGLLASAIGAATLCLKKYY